MWLSLCMETRIGNVGDLGVQDPKLGVVVPFRGLRAAAGDWGGDAPHGDLTLAASRRGYPSSHWTPVAIDGCAHINCAAYFRGRWTRKQSTPGGRQARTRARQFRQVEDPCQTQRCAPTGNCPRQKNYNNAMSCCGLHPFRALGNWLLPRKKKGAKVTPEGTVEPNVAA